MNSISPFSGRDLKRFWSFVDKSEPCWVWTSTKNHGGYGHFGLDDHVCLAHRFSYAIAKGDPGGLCVCHSCDTPACVNPDHLWLGTHADNSRDCTTKGRQSRGERNGRSKLTEYQVLEILKSDETLQTLSERHSISESAVSNIKHGRRWKHLHQLAPESRETRLLLWRLWVLDTYGALA